MNEIVVISGKGGTGKTSIVASLASLAEKKVMVDCDVDASDLHLLLGPDIKKSERFVGGIIPVVNRDKCTHCMECISYCKFNAISDNIEIDPISCEGCGLCGYFCPEKAITLEEKVSGDWFVSDTRYGPFIHAKLGIAESNSGKLVALIRREAKKIASETGLDLIIEDGSPGIGCPVIASITGANLILIVVEPSVSGVHDMKRVHELAVHFNIKCTICINKYDLSDKNVNEIDKYCREHDIDIVGKIPYDIDFTKAQVEAKSIVEFSDGEASKEIKNMWDKISVNLK